MEHEMTECEKRGRHGDAVMTPECSGIFKMACPDCGYWVLVTQDEFVEEIITALAAQGYEDIEVI